MSLDLAILGDDKRPIRWIPISVDEHDRLMGLAMECGLPLIARMNDYYEDATIAADELPAFLDEIGRLQTDVPTNDSLKPLLADLQTLAEQAMQSGRALDALAD